MKTSSSRLVWVMAAVAIVLIAFAPSNSQEARAASDSVSKDQSNSAADWELKDVDGKPVKLSQFKGKVVILDFWATWCAPCRMEIPTFVDLQKRYGNRGLVIIGISLDTEGPQTVKQFMKQFEINYPVVFGNEKVAGDYGGIDGIPATFVINRRGVIVGKHLGYVEKEGFENEIKPLLSKE